MSAPPFMPLFVADYLADTGHLTATEHGAYLMLLMCMWRSGGALPNDDSRLARFAKLTPAQWRRVRPVLIEFFDVADDEITHGRLARELTKHGDAVRQQRERSSNGGKAKARKTKNAPPASGTQKSCQPEPQPEEGEEDKSPSPSVGEVSKKIWELQPEIEGRRRSALPDVQAEVEALIERGADPSEALAAVAGYYRLAGNRKEGGRFSKGAAWVLEADRWREFAPVKADPVEWQGPAAIRTAVVVEQSDDFARCYLDPSGWDGSAIVPRNGYAFDKLRTLRNLRDVKIIDPKERAA